MLTKTKEEHEKFYMSVHKLQLHVGETLWHMADQEAKSAGFEGKTSRLVLETLAVVSAKLLAALEEDNPGTHDFVHHYIDVFNGCLNDTRKRKPVVEEAN